MQKVVSATEARVHFGEIMQDALLYQEPIIVEKAGKPQVVILAYNLYQQLVGPDKEEWRTLLAAGHMMVHQDLHGRTLPSAQEIVETARSARDEELADLPQF
jgi:prevent-host-death family protein